MVRLLSFIEALETEAYVLFKSTMSLTHSQGREEMKQIQSDLERDGE